MRRNFIILSIITGILFVAVSVRIINIANNPPAAYGDEISFAWNAWNILKTGSDEYGIKYPLQFRAFDDYKAPIPVYSLVPFIAIFGLNTFAVRLPIVFFAVATIWMTYLIGKSLLGVRIGLLSALLLAIASWHIHLSRGFFESTIALFFFLGALYLFVTAKYKPNRLIWSSLFFCFTIYSYFTPRIFLLLFIPFLLVWGRRWLKTCKKQLFLFLIILFLLSLPLLYLTIFNSGASRIDKLVTNRESGIVKAVELDRNSVTSPALVKNLLHNRYVYWMRDVTNDYFEQLSLNFWYLNGDASLRYFLGNMGMFYIIELPFLIIGIFTLWLKKRHVFWLLVMWLIYAPFPAAISGRPFAVRTLMMLPAPFFIVSLGIFQLLDICSRVARSHRIGLSRVFKTIVAVGFGASLMVYIVRYHLEYPTYAATWWGWENKAAIDLVLREQYKYDYIFISNFYSGVDLAYAYYTASDPNKYRVIKQNPVKLESDKQFFKFENVYIGSLDISSQANLNLLPPKSLYIGRPEEVSSPESIKAPNDGRVLFNIYRTD